MAYKGKFRPHNIKKYRGNHKGIIYRSLWELRFMRYCDETPSILEWASEEIAIPYVSPLDGDIHRYYPDFWVKVRRGTGHVVWLIEVKPEKQLRPPKQGKRKTKGYLYEIREFGKNTAKWEAAKKYCDKRGWQFNVWTEKTIGLG